MAYEDDEVVQNVRAAIGDRAIYLALLYRSFLEKLPADEVERQARKAVYQFGMIKGQDDQGSMTPDSWVEHHVSCGGIKIFESDVIKAEDRTEVHMTYCPLMAAWQRMGCSEEEMDLLCDVAMEVDRGRADFHKIPYEISERKAKGDPFCRLTLLKK